MDIDDLRKKKIRKFLCFDSIKCFSVMGIKLDSKVVCKYLCIKLWEIKRRYIYYDYKYVKCNCLFI